jgi:phage/plasmid-associated DNA primase
MCYEFVQGNFDSVVERSLNEVLSDLGVNTNVKISSITAIDLQEQFDINDIIEKASNKKYEKDSEVIEDLLKVTCFVPTSQIYVVKDYNAIQKHYRLTYKTKAVFKDILNTIKLRKEEKKWITAWTLFDSEYNSYFKKKGISFYSKDIDILTIFQGYDYPLVDKINYNVFELFLTHVKETITAGDENLFSYALKWYASVVQNPGTKTEAAIVLKGMQGCGKNIFTNVLCKLIGRYAKSNVTTIQELTGNYNSTTESQMLIVLNELKNCGEERAANFDALKSLITDKPLRFNEKNQPR